MKKTPEKFLYIVDIGVYCEKLDKGLVGIEVKTDGETTIGRCEQGGGCISAEMVGDEIEVACENIASGCRKGGRMFCARKKADLFRKQ